MKLLKFLKIQNRHKKILILTSAWTVVFIFLKFFLSLNSLIKISQLRLLPKKSKPVLTLNEMIQISNLSFKYIEPPTCLIKSLVLRRLLLNCTKSAKLKIGIKRIDHELESHAWIEINGLILNNEDVSDYKLIYSES